MSKLHLQTDLPAGFTARPASLDDLDSIVDLINAYYQAAIGMPIYTLEQAHNELTTPGIDLEHDTLLVQSPEGRFAGFIIAVTLASPPVHPNAVGCVHPDFERQGLGTYLLRWAEGRARQAIARVPEGLRVSMRLQIPGTYEPARRLIEKLGLQAIRHSWLMVIDLEEEPPAPQWPPELTLCTYQDRPDLRKVYRAANDAFRDHWGHVEQPEEQAMERWQHSIQSDPEFDPTLWFLLLDGEEIAAVALCHPRSPIGPDMGFVNTLGVRRPWRRRGLGLALLQHTLGEFYRRGKKQVGLGVDAGSLTGATRLYEKAGMRVAQQLDTYELELRPGEELGLESLD